MAAYLSAAAAAAAASSGSGSGAGGEATAASSSSSAAAGVGAGAAAGGGGAKEDSALTKATRSRWVGLGWVGSGSVCIGGGWMYVSIDVHLYPSNHPSPRTSCEIALEQCQGQLSQVAKHITMNLRPLQPQPPE